MEIKTSKKFIELQDKKFLEGKFLDFNKLKFNTDGLLPVIVQNVLDKKILMMAWMNIESLNISIETGFATYFSRSRGKLWKKGETSGHIQKIIKIEVDCDFDCLLINVEQTGPACHTNSPTCFFTTIYERK